MDEEDTTPKGILKIGDKLLQVKDLRFLPYGVVLTESVYHVTVGSQGFYIPKLIVNKHFNGLGIDIFIDEDNKLVIFKPLPKEEAGYLSVRGYRNLVDYLELENGIYLAEWDHERKFLIVDVSAPLSKSKLGVEALTNVLENGSDEDSQMS